MPASSALPQFEDFGELLRHLRKRAGLTQRDLGQAVGYSEAHIARLESGIRLPDVAVVKGAFVEALDLTHEPALATQLVTLAQAAHGKHEAVSDATRKQHAPINLPTPATQLIGREQDVAAVCHHLAVPATRLVTLFGPGGVGKTRLALEVARRLAHEFADGVWWIELAPITEPQAMLTTIAQALNIEDGPGKPVLRALQEHLRDRHALLVLDNLEQALSDVEGWNVANMIGQVLSAAPRLKVLATSRELLQITGEQVYAVNPLGDESVELFVQRAQAVQPNFKLTDANADTIAGICRKLDGLPLAIELAAARCAMFSPAELLSRLDQRLSLLTLGARDLPARQHTLRAAIDWSYQLLPPDEQALFRRLGVFAGGYSLRAVQAFCDADALPLNALDGLSALVTKSLLVREEVETPAGNPLDSPMQDPSEGRAQLAQASGPERHTRYRMLETIREYARERMVERGEYDKWVRIMADYLLSIHSMAKRASPDERENYLSALQWLNATHDETGLALRLAAKIDAYTTNRDEQILCLEQAIKSASVPSDSEHLVFAQAMHGIAIGNRGEREQAIAILKDTLAWYQAHDSRPDAVQGIFHRLGQLHRDLGRVVLSRQYFMKALSIARERGDNAEMRHLYITMAETEIEAEDATEADRLLDTGLAVKAQRDDSVLAWALNHRAHAAMLRGDVVMAEACLKESTQLFSQSLSQGEWGSAWNAQSQGEIALMKDRADQAGAYFTRSLAMLDRMGDKMGMSWSLCGLAGACALNKEAKRGAQLWGAGEALRQKIGCRIAPASRTNRERTTALLKTQLGEAEFAQLEAEGAAWLLEEAVEAALQTPEN
jgi:predicted ATPase/transcriptional regulator with XRE-family HTH domain